MLILHLIDWRHLVIICLKFFHVDNKRHLQNQHTYRYDWMYIVQNFKYDLFTAVLSFLNMQIILQLFLPSNV